MSHARTPLVSQHFFLALGVLLLNVLGASFAHAQTGAAEPARYILAASAGVPLRLTQNSDLGQTRLAPAFADGLVGYVLPSPTRYRHGFGLGASLNLAKDGGYYDPLYAAQQLALMPAYLGYWNFGVDAFALGHLGLPIVLSGGRSFGLEAGCLFGYRLLAGTGVFAEIDLDGFVGAQQSLNVLASLKLGVIVDYEVLP